MKSASRLLSLYEEELVYLTRFSPSLFCRLQRVSLRAYQQLKYGFKFPILYPFNYADWNPKMSAYLKRQYLFDVSIGALSEPESYEEKIGWINNCDRDYGIMFLGMSPNIHHES